MQRKKIYTKKKEKESLEDITTIKIIKHIKQKKTGIIIENFLDHYSFEIDNGYNRVIQGGFQKLKEVLRAIEDELLI